MTESNTKTVRVPEGGVRGDIHLGNNHFACRTYFAPVYIVGCYLTWYMLCMPTSPV